MDRETLFRQLDRRYASKRDMLSRIPLGVDPDALWRELLDRRRSRAALLPLFNGRGSPYWYVTTDRMIAASEKVVGALLENETEFDPYTDAPTVSNLEEVYFTSYVEGSQISMQDAMDFLTGESAPRDIEEQMIANNRAAGSYARENLFMRVDAELLRELTVILTEGMDGGGSDYRTGEVSDHSLPHGEQYPFPAPQSIPQHMDEMTQLLETPQIHPLIKAAAAQAYIMILRPFQEGNERLGRLISGMVLLRAGYSFLSEVSLSALIARKSYGYYEAMTNILREENGGDLTYFFEYYLDLLARAVDERALRSERRTEENRQAEISMARTALGASPQDPDKPPSPPTDYSGGGNKRKTEAGWIGKSTMESVSKEQKAQPGTADLSGYKTVQIAETMNDVPPEKMRQDQIEILMSYASDQSRPLGRAAAYVLRLIDEGQPEFSTNEMCTGAGIGVHIVGGAINALLKNGIIRFVRFDHGRRRYMIFPGDEPSTRAKSEPPHQESFEQNAPSIEESPEPAAAAVEETIEQKLDELDRSNSPKDKRIAMMIRKHIPDGKVVLENYDAISEHSRFVPDMEFAAQLGLVEKESYRAYRILDTPSTSPPLLNYRQRRIFTQIYELFGDTAFSVDMVIARLDYSGPNVSAYLHQFTMLRLIDCRKDDVNWYQFLVTPEQNPEYFDLAS